MYRPSISEREIRAEIADIDKSKAERLERIYTNHNKHGIDADTILNSPGHIVTKELADLRRRQLVKRFLLKKHKEVDIDNFLLNLMYDLYILNERYIGAMIKGEIHRAETLLDAMKIFTADIAKLQKIGTSMPEMTDFEEINLIIDKYRNENSIHNITEQQGDASASVGSGNNEEV